MTKLSYEKPSFKKYGSMKELTLASAGSGADMDMSFGGDDGPNQENVDTAPGNQVDGGPNAETENDAGPTGGDDTTGVAS